MSAVPPPQRLVVINTPFCLPRSLIPALQRTFATGRLAHFYSKQFGAKYDLDDLAGFRPDFVDANFDCLVAHAPLQTFSAKVGLAPAGPWRAITVLRHPIGRMADAYQHDLDRRAVPGGDERLVGFEDFIRSARPSNAMCRYVAGVATFAEAARVLIEAGVLFCPFEEVPDLLELIPGLATATAWTRQQAIPSPHPAEAALPPAALAWLANRVGEDLLLYLWARDRWRSACYAALATSAEDAMNHPIDSLARAAV